MDLRRRTLWILGAFLLLISFFVLLLFGNSYTFKLDIPEGTDVSDYHITVDEGDKVVSVKDMKIKDGKLELTFQSESRGKVFFEVEGPNDFFYMDVIYVHRFNIMTINSYMGYTRGSRVIPITGLLFLLTLLVFNITEYRKRMKESMYQYENVRALSWIIFDTMLITNQVMFVFSDQALTQSLKGAMSSASSIAMAVFPLAFILSILVCISNIRLMMKEGRTWRNMLGVIMGAAICIGTIIPQVLSAWLNSNLFSEMHNEKSAWLYVEMLITNLVLVMVSYLECILIGTIIMTVKAARKVPAFDKDYILILGCQIRKDGTLTKLLQGRADRALEFAKMQSDNTSKPLTFVPSGGKGSDEVISESQAIHNYLVEKGIPEDKIIVEDSSTSTEENMRKSFALIEQQSSDPKVAFATTNYHVFRSGVLAYREGINAEGIGSKTRTYFWVNAFVREFIATLYAERIKHHRVIRALSLTVTLSVVLVYYAAIL
ncbi:MAG: YdcF family protein [Clostridiales bacterium]|nr:YdcF family protein [Clostridiales bacterium]